MCECTIEFDQMNDLLIDLRIIINTIVRDKNVPVDFLTKVKLARKHAICEQHNAILSININILNSSNSNIKTVDCDCILTGDDVKEQLNDIIILNGTSGTPRELINITIDLLLLHLCEMHEFNIRYMLKMLKIPYN